MLVREVTDEEFQIEVHTSGAAFGAEIHNINLKDYLSDQEKKTLRQALDYHEVILFPDQNLDPSQQKEATRIFGPLLPSYTFLDHLDDDPEIGRVIKIRITHQKVQCVGMRI